MVGGFPGLVFFAVLGFLVLGGLDHEEKWKYPVRLIVMSLMVVALVVLIGGFDPIYDHMRQSGWLELRGWNARLR